MQVEVDYFQQEMHYQMVNISLSCWCSFGPVWQLVNLSLCTFPKKVPFCCLEM